jgi:hypothetical protein
MPSWYCGCSPGLSSSQFAKWPSRHSCQLCQALGCTRLHSHRKHQLQPTFARTVWLPLFDHPCACHWGAVTLIWGGEGDGYPHATPLHTLATGRYSYTHSLKEVQNEQSQRTSDSGWTTGDGVTLAGWVGKEGSRECSRQGTRVCSRQGTRRGSACARACAREQKEQ